MDIALDQYFDRTGFKGSVNRDLSTLTALHSAHVAAIPFEGADPLLGRPVQLDLPSLEAKLVLSRRGGYCFEQNTLFKAVLERIGFKVTGLGARVRWMSPPDSPLGPREHMLLKVDLAEGTYLADVGFGACLMDAPLRLKTGIEQQTRMGTFLLTEIDGLYTLAARQPGGWRTMYAFDLEPQRPSDYELGNWYTSTHPKAPFLHVLIMERLGADQRHKLVNTRYIVEARDGEIIAERDLATPAALGEVLQEVFKVQLPTSMEDLFARISQKEGIAEWCIILNMSVNRYRGNFGSFNALQHRFRQIRTCDASFIRPPLSNLRQFRRCTCGHPRLKAARPIRPSVDFFKLNADRFWTAMDAPAIVDGMEFWGQRIEDEFHSRMKQSGYCGFETTIQPFEIIVVDDGSTDDSVAFLRGQYSGKIKIIESENKGQLSAFVLGYQQARGDFVAFLDADDIWKPNHLQVVKDVLDRHPKVDFVMTNNEYFGNATGNFWKGKHDIDYGTSRFVAWTRDWIGSPTSSLVVRHDLLAFISDLTDATLADWRIRADDVLVYGGSIFGGHKYRIAAPTVHYRVHNNNGFFGIKMTSQANKRWKIRKRNSGSTRTLHSGKDADLPVSP
eukprot:gene18144-18389_t